LEQQETVVHADVPSTPYARAMMELLEIPADDELLTVVEEAIESKAGKENMATEVAANELFLAAAMVKIEKGSDGWLASFRQLLEIARR
jgi:hypothetical protein